MCERNKKYIKKTKKKQAEIEVGGSFERGTIRPLQGVYMGKNRHDQHSGKIKGDTATHPT